MALAMEARNHIIFRFMCKHGENKRRKKKLKQREKDQTIRNKKKETVGRKEKKENEGMKTEVRNTRTILNCDAKTFIYYT